MAEDMVFPMILSKGDMVLLRNLLRAERDYLIAQGAEALQRGLATDADTYRQNAADVTRVLEKIQGVTPIGQSITIDDLIFYSVHYYKSRNRRQHVEAVSQWQYLTGDDRTTAYGINNRLIELVAQGELIEERKNQYTGWRYRLSDNRQADAERVKALIQAWTEYRAWNK